MSFYLSGNWTGTNLRSAAEAVDDIKAMDDIKATEAMDDIKAVDGIKGVDDINANSTTDHL